MGTNHKPDVVRDKPFLVKNFKQWNDMLSMWLSPEYINESLNKFYKIEKYLQGTDAIFNNVMDIGCGVAHIPQHFQNKYGSNLFLLEGSSKDHHTFYGKLEDIDFQLQRKGIQNYELIDITYLGPNFKPLYKKMDLITSFLAVGHHFDVQPFWSKWIKEHSTDETKIIFDLRKKSLQRRCKGVKIVEVIDENDQKILAEVKII